MNIMTVEKSSTTIVIETLLIIVERMGQIPIKALYSKTKFNQYKIRG